MRDPTRRRRERPRGRPAADLVGRAREPHEATIVDHRAVGSAQRRRSEAIGGSAKQAAQAGVVQRLTDISRKEGKQHYAKAKNGTEIEVESHRGGNYDCHGLTFDSGPDFEFSPTEAAVPSLLTAEGAKVRLNAKKLDELRGDLKKGDVAEFNRGGGSAHTSRILEDGELKSYPDDALEVKVKQRDKFGKGDENSVLWNTPASGYPVSIWGGLPAKVTTGGKTELGDDYRAGK